MFRISTLVAATVAASLFTAPVMAAELTGTLKKIKDTGVIKVGHRDASVPFSYLDDQQKPIGYGVDICMKIVDKVKAVIVREEKRLAEIEAGVTTRPGLDEMLRQKGLK